jgi:hypothetical protein
MSPEVAMRSVVHSCVRALALVCLFVPADGRLGRSLALPQEAGSAGASPSRLGPALQQDNAKADKVEAKKAEELKLEDLFPKKSMFGKRARGVAWSHDDRYLAYLWNAYDDKGYDLWVYDTKEKKARRITSPELFVAFDRELKPIIERYK